MAAKNGGLKGFLLRRDKLLTVLGAIIVFATFMVREGAREHLKEVAESVAAGQNAYASAANMTYMGDSEFFYEVKDQMNAAFQRGETAQSEDADDRLYMGALARLMPLVPKYLTTMRYNLIQVAEVAEVLRHGVAINARVEKELDRLKKMEDCYDALPHLTAKQILDKKNRDKDSHILIQVAGMYPTLAEFEIEMQSLNHDVLKEATEERKKAEQWYGRCTWASYVLYSLGWGLGLIGKIYGAGRTAGGE